VAGAVPWLRLAAVANIPRMAAAKRRLTIMPFWKVKKRMVPGPRVLRVLMWEQRGMGWPAERLHPQSQRCPSTDCSWGSAEFEFMMLAARCSDALWCNSSHSCSSRLSVSLVYYRMCSRFLLCSAMACTSVRKSVSV
jgi:hypothetical protein